MLYQALLFLLTPVSPLAKKYGFLYQSIALKARYERCKKAWLPHLKSCQDLFLQVLQQLPQKKSIVILGSSHLHEIPLHLLTQNFESITLVDVVHPLRHHWLAKKNPRFKLITTDLSQSLEHLEGLNSLEDLHALIAQLQEKTLFHFAADLIVSGNLLSQLALLPIESIEKKIHRPLSLDEKDVLCTAFAELHLKNLRGCRGAKLVYSDREVSYRNPQQELIYQGQYPVSFEGFTKLKEWTWLLAPITEASKNYSIEMKVEAYFLTATNSPS
ncbi:MAG: hypothetical protein AAGB31_07380 [Bdellovibrio sp.]